MNVFVFVSLLCCAVSALTVAETHVKPSARMSAAKAFKNASATTHAPHHNVSTTMKPQPTKLHPTKPHPTKPQSTKLHPTEPHPTKPQPTKLHPTEPHPTKPQPTKPQPTKPQPTKPQPTKPKPTKPKPTKPQPTKPKPTKPQPTTHAPNHTVPTTTKPHPTKPQPTKPKPTKPAPPPGPTPPTKLTVGNYTLQSKDKKSVCLKAQMALQVRLVLPKENGTFIVQPNKTHTAGDCQETKANLTLVFPEGHITFLFNKSVANNTVYVDSVDFNITYPLKKTDTKNSAKNISMHLFSAKIGNSYSCREESVFMGNGLYLDITQDRVQAFNFTKSNDFGYSDRCVADQPDYRVPVAVGLTLLVLILIVLVAYLVGRRKRTDGYQTL